MSKADQRFVVVGGGQAAGQLIETVRKENFEGKITLVTEEHLLPYQRPHLSKLYLSGTLAEQKLLYRPENFYSKNNVEVMLNQRVDAIDRSAKSIRMADGSSLTYHKLAITTGARVRKLPIPGAEVNGVYYLRSVTDSDQIRDKLKTAQRVVFIGGGFLCLEAASVIVALGKEATVLEVQDRVMANAVAPQISEFYQNLHADRGVKIHTRTQVASIAAKKGWVSGVMTADGQEFPADLVIVSVGVQPNEELAAEAGIHCNNGICVNEYAVTSDPDIVAAGDCTNHPNAYLQRNLRLESVHNAVEQAKTAAVSMCGLKMPYRQVPWFWSDQYDYRMHMVGISQTNDQTIVRGSVSAGKFSVLFFRDNQLVACNAVNQPFEYMNCRKILENRIELSVAEASQPGFDLAKLIPRKAKLAFQRRHEDTILDDEFM